MPKLTDVAVVKIGKQRFADAQKGLYTFRRTSFPQPELSLRTKLRTNVSIVDVNQTKPFEYPIESKGIYASWRSELERKPVHDLYQSQPLNQVKDTTQEDIQEFILKRNHKDWLAEVDERMRKLGFKP